MMLRHKDIENDVINLNDYDRIAFVAQTIILGLMKLPLYLRVVRKIIKWRFRIGQSYATITLLSMLHNKSPITIDNMIDDFLDHLHNGKDASGEAIIGGFNNAELNMTEDTLRIIKS